MYTYTYWPPVAAARRGFKMVLFTASRGNTFVGGTSALLSAILQYVSKNQTAVNSQLNKVYPHQK